ncbi:MAG: hypothetical protein GY809_26175 [Planctomycetes bacterium]|nr:hypothetical protein [Planctomycetota bacterium]
MRRQNMVWIMSVVALALGVTSNVSADLVARWDFNAGEGTTVVDTTGNGYDGAFEGSPEWVEGKYGGGVHFRGMGEIDYVSFVFPDGDVVWTAGTIAIWAKADSVGQVVYTSPFTNRTTNASGIQFGMDGADPGIYRINPGTITFGPVSTDWVHLALAWEGDAGTLYYNGVEAATATLSDSQRTFNAFVVGTNRAHNFGFAGIVDDLQIFDNALTNDEIVAAMQGVAPGSASDPNPEDEGMDVPRDATLNWEPGEFAHAHNVYVGTSFEDVNNATVPTAADLSVNAFDAGRLEFDQTYYWRVDEVNGTPDKTVYKGNVWSFATEPYSIQIPGAEIAVTAASSANEFSLPEKLIDGSGLGEDGSHDITPETMWFTASPDVDPWIQFKFDDVKQLDTMTIWNSNGAAESAIGWGVKDVVVEYSRDGESWTVLEGVNQISRAPGLPTYAQPDEIAFNDVPVKYVRLDIGSNWGGILMSYSLSEVQFNMIPAQARTPDPASGATDILPGDTVTWRAGREAAEHTVYISTDVNAVADGTAPSVTTPTNSLNLGTLGLDLGETYYWGVDEVNDAEETPVWAGPVWNLSIVSAVVVDDFESYNNLSPDRPFQTWLDGFGYSADEFFSVGYGGNGTGAGIGHDIWSLSSPHYAGDIMETTTVIAGSSQSLPLYFDNSGGASQTDRTFATPQDWTLGGVTTLSIAVHGDLSLPATNTLYAKINGTQVTYDGDLSVPIWRPWHVDLTSLGINLSSVTTLSIGVEGSGSGMVLLDDILLHKTAPVINEPPAGSDMSLVAHWELDETEGLDVADSSGYVNSGTLIGMDGSEWTAGIQGGALELTGASSTSPKYVRFEDVSSLQLTDSATISAWVKMNEGNDDVYMGIAGKLVSGNYQGFSLVRHSSNVFRLWCDDGAGVLVGFEADSDGTYTDTEWHHVAGVIDDGTSILYVDGARQAKEGNVDLTDSGTYAQIGRQYSDDSSHRYWNGLIDDVRIYYRALSEQEISGL